MGEGFKKKFLTQVCFNYSVEMWLVSYRSKKSIDSLFEKDLNPNTFWAIVTIQDFIQLSPNHLNIFEVFLVSNLT